jgi:hypothetical protein
MKRFNKIEQYKLHRPVVQSVNHYLAIPTEEKNNMQSSKEARN